MSSNKNKIKNRTYFKTYIFWFSLMNNHNNRNVIFIFSKKKHSIVIES